MSRESAKTNECPEDKAPRLRASSACRLITSIAVRARRAKKFGAARVPLPREIGAENLHLPSPNQCRTMASLSKISDAARPRCAILFLYRSCRPRGHAYSTRIGRLAIFISAER